VVSIVDCIAVLTERGTLSAAGALPRADPIVRGVVRKADRGCGADESARAAVILSRGRQRVSDGESGDPRRDQVLVETAGVARKRVRHDHLAGGSVLHRPAERMNDRLDPGSAAPANPSGRLRGGVGGSWFCASQCRAVHAVCGLVLYVELSTHAQFRERCSQALRLLADPWDEDI